MQPTFAVGAERRSIRTYSDFVIPQHAEEPDTSGEDSDSGMGGLGLGEQTTDEQRLARNQQYFEEHVENFTLSLQDAYTINGMQIQTILNPTISKMSSFCLHPNLYTNIQPLPTLSQMARILGTDPVWEEKYTTFVADNPVVMAAFRTLCGSGDHEPSIHSQLSWLVMTISTALDVSLTPHSEKALAIGGMLVREEFDICGRSDPHFENSNGQTVFCTEIKPNNVFPLGSFWHRECRGTQILACMLAHCSPAALVTPRQFKFFFESVERDTIFTYPADQDPASSQFLNASLMGPMGRDFLKAICICLLSPRARCAQEDKSDGGKKSDQQKANPAAKVRAPTFLSGYQDGRPVYTTVRVASEEAAHAILQLKRQQDAATARSGAAVPVHGLQAAAATPPRDLDNPL